jgi:imidazolonepropionase
LSSQTGEAAPGERWLLIRRARQLLTLHGPSGPRRGSATRELHIIKDGALLIHNGAIVEVGPTQRIENLQRARGAREIDALGKIVMPAFVDADAPLISPPMQNAKGAGEMKQMPLRLVAKKRVESGALASAAAWVRCGVLTVGAHSGYARDFRDTARILRIHQGLQKTLRIRSVFAPRGIADRGAIVSKWLPVLRKRKLASVLELDFTGEESFDGEALRALGSEAAALGYSLRLRTGSERMKEACDFALAAGAIALVSAAAPPSGYVSRLADAGCVHILPAVSEAGTPDRHHLRACIDDGAAIAIASSYDPAATSSFNPQYLLYAAKERLGLNDEEAICAVTWNAACALRMPHVAGSLEPGKPGDVLVMDVPDYRELTRRPGHNDVLTVLRGGRAVYRRAGLISD